jgi:hypothetical protein
MISLPSSPTAISSSISLVVVVVVVVVQKSTVNN